MVGQVESGPSKQDAVAATAARITAIQKQLANRVLTCHSSAPELLETLHTIEFLDREAEPKDRLWKAVKWTFGIVFVISLILAIPTAGYTLWVGIPSLLGLLISWPIHAYYSHRNVENRRYAIPAALVRHVAVDMKPGARIGLRIDFRHFRQRQFHQRREKEGFLSSVTVHHYELPWLVMKGRLLDGTRFRYKITMQVKRKEKAKRKRTKVTQTFRERVHLLLAVQADRYPELARFPECIQQVQPPQGLQIETARVNGSTVHLQASSIPDRVVGEQPKSLSLNQHSSLQLLLAAYNCLGRCRPGRAA